MNRRGRSGAQPNAATGAHPAAGREEPSVSRRGEASGNYPITARREPPSRRGEASGAYPAANKTKSAAPRANRRAESAAERTEVITRPDEGDYPAAEASDSSRTLTRTESTRAKRRTDTTETGENTAPPRRSESTGSHRTVGKGDATGSHRIVGKKAPRRRIATWPIACLVLAALIGLGIVGWNWADSELNNRAEAQAASCSGGTSHMRVVVTPSVQKPLTAAAERWNQAATVVHGQCVHVMIEAKPSSQVLDALVGRANLDSIGGLPAAWLPESSYWVSELTTKKPEMIGSAAQSVANARSADYPFIGLSGQGVDDTLLRAAQTFREYLEQPAQQADFAAAGIKST
ncbi:substrate-binding domain-containing protein [Amycolatopsis solani]|uniref:substrate-binding domain-containing protein n=1 Tax=Amycolatopsis solani TaxID=3028615 RepID=UPI0025B1E746|nr:substrate-binding domain-containing protein [Amycolatopsis sp. MEP2-6]